MAAKKSNDTVKAGILVGIIIFGVGGRLYLSRRGGSTQVTPAGRRAPGRSHGTAAPRPGGGGAAPAAAPVDIDAKMAVRPENIPELIDEVKHKLKNQGAGGTPLYQEDELGRGFNPFLPFEVSDSDIKRQGGIIPGGEPVDDKPKFDRKLSFYGAFTTDDETRAIIKVERQPVAWTGRVGEKIAGTPYRLREVDAAGRWVELEDTKAPDSRPIRLEFERAGKKPAGPASPEKGSSGLFRKGPLPGASP